MVPKLVKRAGYTFIIFWLIIGANGYVFFGMESQPLFETITELIAGICFVLLLWPQKEDSIKKWGVRISKHHLIIVLLFILITNFIEEAFLIMSNDNGNTYLQGILWSLSLGITTYLLFRTTINNKSMSKQRN